MLTLYQFPPFWNLPNASPFCLKLETYLRMAEIPYANRYIVDLRKAPKKKFPFIKDDEQIISDTSLIIAYLKNKYGDSLDQFLTPEQHALRISVQHMVEEHLYWVMLYSRWIAPQGWAITKSIFFSKVPALLRNIIANTIQKKVKKSLYEQGIGRHTEEEIYQFGNEDIDALSVLLGDKPFFFEKPSSIDATLYGFLVNLIKPPIESPLKKNMLQKRI